MRKTIMAAMAAVSLIAVSGCNKQPAAGGNDSTQVAAAGDINGTWKADIDSIQFDTKPDALDRRLQQIRDLLDRAPLS